MVQDIEYDNHEHNKSHNIGIGSIDTERYKGKLGATCQIDLSIKTYKTLNIVFITNLHSFWNLFQDMFVIVYGLEYHIYKQNK